MLKPERFYEGVLRAYYYSCYEKYEDETEWFVNPAPNKWKFRIPSIDTTITLTCSDKGEVTEQRCCHNRLWYNVELTKGTAEKLKEYLWEHDIQFEPSECYNLTHFECYMTEGECESMNEFLQKVIFSDHGGESNAL